MIWQLYCVVEVPARGQGAAHVAQAPTPYTPEEYLALERQAPCKSEYYAGDIFAMAGASRWHNLIVTNVLRELSLQLKGRPCTTYPSDRRVKVSPTGLYTYPDVTVVCGEAQFEDLQQDTLALTPEEQNIVARTRKTRKCLVFRREQRHELRDVDGQHARAQRDSPEPGEPRWRRGGWRWPRCCPPTVMSAIGMPWSSP
jgi:hypothetical protein